MALESIKKMKRPLNAVAQAAKSPNVCMAMKRIGCKYVDGGRIPANGPVTGRIIDGKHAEKQASEKKRVRRGESDSPRSYEDRSPRNAKQQIDETVPRGRFFAVARPSPRSCLNHRRRSVLYTCIQLVLASPGRPASRGIDSSERNIVVVEILSRGSNRASPERADFVLFRRMGLVM